MILDEIAEKARVRVAESKKRISPDVMAEKAKQKAKATEPFRFEKALAKDGVSFVCEVKKASPSKGVIAEDFDYLAIAKDYEKAGADAISVLAVLIIWQKLRSTYRRRFFVKTLSWMNT